MRYTLTIRDEDYARLQQLVFSMPEVEGVALLLCGESRTPKEVRLFCREVIPIRDEHYRVREPDFLSLDAGAYVPLAKRARSEKLSVVFVHSHPGGFLAYSDQDNSEEPKLQEFLRARIPDRIHGSLILTSTGVIGRVWSGDFVPLSRVRIIGSKFEFHDHDVDNTDPLPFFDRQVAAFGPEIQKLLGRLHVGVVGAGGTGSPIVEQLNRLGVGEISIYDRDRFDPTNVNRVYGSGTEDTDQPKVDLAVRNIERIGLPTQVLPYPEHITEEAIATTLRDCDIIFGCTDKETPRAILVQLALRYLIPVFDMGVVLDSEEGILRDVVGRVTTLLAGEACLFCRGRITPKTISLESFTDEQRAALAAEGYAPGLQTRSPAVVPFTSATASLAISELLHRLTGYMGPERVSSEILLFFDKSRLRTNRPQPAAECLCTQRHLWGKGDTKRFLDMSWGS